MKFPPIAIVIPVFCLSISPNSLAEDYQGAEAILKQAEGAPASAKPVPKPDDKQQLLDDIKSFQEHASILAPTDAATGWVDLFDRALLPDGSREPQFYSGFVPPRIAQVFKVLPPPADWDALADEVARRPAPAKGSADFATPVLNVVVAALENRSEAIRSGIDAMKGQIENLDESRRNTLRESVREIEEAYFTLEGDTGSAVANFEARLELLQPGKDTSVPGGRGQIIRAQELDVPDLVALSGHDRAATLLEKVFTAEVRSASFHGERTRALAREVAVKMGARLKFAPWSLVDTLDSTGLYELLDKQFANDPNSAWQRRNADAYYLLGLIASNRTDDAVAIAIKLAHSSSAKAFGYTAALDRLPDEAMLDMAAKGYAGQVAGFFARLLTDHPDLPYWESYTAAAVMAGETDSMLGRVKAASEDAGIAPMAKEGMRKAYGDALLAADHLQEALPILRESAAAGAKAASTAGADENQVRAAMRAIVSLASLGELIGDNALVNEQLDAIQSISGSKPQAILDVYMPGGGSLSEIFLGAHRGPQMERLLADALGSGEAEAVKMRAQPGGNFRWSSYEIERQIRRPLYELVDLYSRARRFEDVVLLLDRCREWGAEDLSTLLLHPIYADPRSHAFVECAHALRKTGHPEAALAVVNASLEASGGGYDPAYELLLELLPPEKAEARLDELFRGDQFEERPLIWRAVLELGQGRLEDAEKSARQAIAIDPSDGEEGRGDRMRAYSVLADILDRKGDSEKAGQMRQVVKAIRLSEDADLYHSAGLLTRAVGMYRQALGYFADAYCIQSRLAIQLTALGKFDEAMTHYERAYELMPESFGRMESHCFGCERAFAGQRAQSAAERVFGQLAEKQPENPRVHYLLGYLRMEEDRNTEAAVEFREAVRLDPDYINAWKQLASNTDDPAERGRAQLNLLRLDPRHKHDSADLKQVADFRALWTAVESAAKLVPAEPASLYPLAASKTAIEQERRHTPKPGDMDAFGFGGSIISRVRGDEAGPLTPQGAILKNPVIAGALELLAQNRGGS